MGWGALGEEYSCQICWRNCCWPKKIFLNFYTTLPSPPKSSTQNLWNMTKICSVWAKHHRLFQICGVWVKHHRFFPNTIWAVYCHCLCAFVSSTLSFCLYPIFCSVRSKMCSTAAAFQKLDWKWFLLQHLAVTSWNPYLVRFAQICKYTNANTVSWC